VKGENGTPETPDWHPVPRCWPEHGPRCECEPFPLHDGIELGEN